MSGDNPHNEKWGPPAHMQNMPNGRADSGRYYDEKGGLASGEISPTDAEPLLAVGAAGRLPEDVYERTLSPWRNALRKKFNVTVARESVIIAKMQSYVRHPVLDTYFVYTSFLGTHTFFMIMLPALCFFGHAELGRRLIFVLALGVYVTSFVKDLMCSPRPYAPPVTRFVVGNHHLEYGLPSTHSTNSVSIALMFFSIMRKSYNTPLSSILPGASAADLIRNATEVATAAMPQVQQPAVSPFAYYTLSSILVIYVFSVVYGRLYTGMHSFTDVGAGVIMGVLVYVLEAVCDRSVDNWIATNGIIVPLIIIPVCLLMVHWHPQPVDDCPCFEDAIAFVSVVMGEMTFRWYMRHHGFNEDYFKILMVGSSWETPMDVAAWTALAFIKLLLGILTIFVWRIFAKSLFHAILPPTFRLLSHLFTLPHRRFYIPATDYTSVPPEKTLRAVPSVIDLPHMMELQLDEGGASGWRPKGYGALTGNAAVKLRGAKGRGGEKGVQEKMAIEVEMEANCGKVDGTVKHYDADVLTKVFVYCGIAILATGVIPIMFEVLGWGVRS